MAAVVHIDAREVKRLANAALPELARQIPFALSRALNDAGKELQADILNEMRAKFDRPTPWVMRGVVLQFATKQDLKVEVYFNPSGGGTPTSRVLPPHIYGGGRPMKRFERRLGSYAVPGAGAKLDRYGNIKGSELVKALSALGGFADTGQNRTVRSGRSKREHFFQQGRVIFRRTGRDIEPMLVQTRAPSYTPILTWQQKADSAARDRLLAVHFPKRFEEAIRTAKPKR